MARTVGDANLSEREHRFKAQLAAEKETNKAKQNALKAKIVEKDMRIKELKGRM